MRTRLYRHADTSLSDILVIRLDEPTDNCCVCGDEVYMDYGLPMYESEIVPSDWAGAWCGFTSCKRCYDLFTPITAPLPLRDAVKMLQQGEPGCGCRVNEER